MLYIFGNPHHISLTHFAIKKSVALNPISLSQFLFIPSFEIFYVYGVLNPAIMSAFRICILFLLP